MASSPLTLAALATAAVPGLRVASAGSLDAGGPEVDAALLADRDGTWHVVRVPRSDAARARITADLAALRALSQGVRARLPFHVTSLGGQQDGPSGRVVVTEHIAGDRTPLSAVTTELGASLGRAIAAIHLLPTSVATDAGLPALSSVHALQETSALIDRTLATGVVPAAIRERWEHALEDMRLWQFQPTVVHGELGPDSIRSHAGEVVGVLDWQSLRVADPARDLSWLIGGRPSAIADAVFQAYADTRGSVDGHLRSRASLYAELEIARWLLHGTETRSTDIVDDAVRMLHGLVDDVHNDVMGPLGPRTAPVLAVHEVEAMLDRVERAG
ncbi:phosphotransferase [Homoserinibacter sp. YIM 151385]|uniref:phosphotransferase n=1 Tax=Homoserinibacter sp. YIM 151385 TaxID=2985506 RepID=UPI0022F0FC61|nr:phosphotransferase [Homoserinibacter sp. YIM 151385]WBU38153.1 phosphotransferase [Homoserinibacter sp. YIM 151385]